MSFLGKKNNKEAVTFKVTMRIDAARAQQAANDVQTIVSTCTPEELNVLAKVVQKPTVKSLALAKAKQFVN